MTISFWLFVACALAAIGALQVLSRPSDAAVASGEAPRRSVWHLTLTTPALLVPALLAAIAGVIVVEAGGHRVFAGRWWGSISYSQNIVWVGIMAILVAGYVGLLDALYKYGKADGAHFWQGVKDHVLTFFLAKAAIWGVALAIVESLAPRNIMTPFLFLAPSLLFAPLLGTAAQHPRRPFRAIRAAIDRTWDLPTTSRLICYQVLVMLGLWIGMHAVRDSCLNIPHSMQSVAYLSRDCSALSFNTFPWFFQTHAPFSPYLPHWHGFWVGLAFGGVSMFFSAVFMHLHFRRVLQRPERIL